MKTNKQYKAIDSEMERLKIEENENENKNINSNVNEKSRCLLGYRVFFFLLLSCVWFLFWANFFGLPFI